MINPHHYALLFMKCGKECVAGSLHSPSRTDASLSPATTNIGKHHRTDKYTHTKEHMIKKYSLTKGVSLREGRAIRLQAPYLSVSFVSGSRTSRGRWEEEEQEEEEKEGGL